MVHKNGGYSYHVPINERLYVFEEIDSTLWRNIIKPRTNDDVPQQQYHDDIEIVDEKIIIKKKEEELFTLGNLLELLDGVIEMEGRMILFTTNHPERLDPALLRPGRIDTIIEFTNMCREDVANMYRLWFDMDIPNDVYSKMKDYTFSQAEIGKIFSLQDFDKIHKQLTG